ncbi:MULTISPECIES: hypothetical protein [unclassified Leifsonia]|uniref:hypothetical protein n=1 Tax=unclassified Leifsonia TaxID=2663824 RepID=UPI0008A72F49|nr:MULTISPECIES: hypothetical protein [unclassified Leifsonia]SEI10137.1 hypothetical protein SAMN04515694_11558 [Leifsonia sp. CL154]SFL86581.1 hypothetical protein SAMN04515692_11550 [Leifsonia sp. CL147]
MVEMVFPGFGTGWYFPESLQTAPSLPDPAPNAQIPEYEVFLESMQQGLARAENEANGSHHPETAPIDVIDLPELPPAITGSRS